MADAKQTNTKNGKKEVPSLFALPRIEKLRLLALFVSNMLFSMSFSLMSPFFPDVAEAKDMSPAVTGWVFGIYSLTQFIFGFFSGKLISILGLRSSFLGGYLSSGVSTILFGFVDRIPTSHKSNTLFTTLCFTLRIILSIGSTCSLTAALTIASETFTENIPSVMGLLETAFGVGLMVGPFIGGLLYQVGGFSAPFITQGVVMISAIPLFAYLLQGLNGNTNQEAPISACALLKVPVIVCTLVTILAVSFTWTSLTLILELHLSLFHLSPFEVGMVFLLMSSVYAFLAPVAGRIAELTPNSTILMVIGFAVTVIGLLLLGPSPLIGLESYKQLWLVLVSLVILGIGLSLALIPTFDKIIKASSHFESCEGLVAGLWTSCYALGEFLAPIYGGTAFVHIGFSWTVTVVALMCFLVLLMTIIMFMHENKIICSHDTPSEYSHLLENGVAG